MRLAALLFIAACGSSQSPPPQSQPSNQAPPADPQVDDDKHKLELAQKEADEARKAAQEAREKVEKVQRDLDDLQLKLDKVVDDLAASQNDADRSAARARLDQLRKEKAEIEARAAEARAAAQKAERKKGMQISKECLDNPLAKGCN